MSGRILKFDDSAHRAADEMLPWFVNGTLDGDDLAAVDRHVRECARCRREVDLLKQLQAVCASDGPTEDATPAYRRLHERIASGRSLSSFGDRVCALLLPWQCAPAWARWAIAAEFAGIVMLAAWVAMPVGEPIGLFQTLGAPATHTARGGRIAVVFVPEVAESELRRIVRDAGARLVDGPTESNEYVLEVPPGDQDAILAAFRVEPAVMLAQPLTAAADR